MKRNHELYVGERVYDANKQYVGHIKELKAEKAIIEMIGDDENENRLMFDCEIEENELVWETETEALYQFVPDLYDREGNPICYEHMETEDEYPYFSPYLFENLFSFETFTYDKL